jgi:hypothetical protein
MIARIGNEVGMRAALPILTRSRLQLRPLELADADALQQVFPRWQIELCFLVSRSLALPGGWRSVFHPRCGFAGNGTGRGVALDYPAAEVPEESRGLPENRVLI